MKRTSKLYWVHPAAPKWVNNRHGHGIAKCSSPSMAKKIAAALNKEWEVQKMIKDGGF